ncbi:MAG: molybdopterin-dependent oxidoreductase [Pseudomonadota bacterium]|nr:molybdopterin-dependent oxidoreductase [Pseudomonadota bacterium]
MKETKHTFCRICEASCGLVAEMEGGKIVDLKPNRDHIGTDGFACMKGLNQHRMYDSPDRLQYPLKRVGDRFERISWAQAYAEIGAKVKGLRAISPHAISMYVGTAAGFSLLHPIFAEGFMKGIGSRSMFSSSTQDCANRFASATEMYGFPFTQPFVDLDHVRYMLIVGTNPIVSKWTFLQVAHPGKRLKDVRKRGGRIVVVDPRETETAKMADAHQFIRPNTDVFFFLSFLHELFAQNGVDREHTQRYMTGLADIEALAGQWPAEKTSALTGINADALKAMVGDYIAAGASAIVTGTGLGMGRHGTLAQWLADVINAISGNLDRQGGVLLGEGLFDFAAYAKKEKLFQRIERSRIGAFRELNGGFPGGILADEILKPGTEQIKALFVTGGNPLLTMPNSARLRKALGELDLLVVTDIYLNETASLAHYVLPATSPLERADLPFVFPLFLGMQSRSYIAATDAIVEPSGEQRDEATMYTQLARACGVSLFGARPLQWIMQLMLWANAPFRRGRQPSLPIRLILDLILRSSKVGRFRDVVKQPQGLAWRGGPKPDSYLGKRVVHDDGKVHLAPPMLMEQTSRLTAIFADETASYARGELRLISKRMHSTHNSWTQNIAELTNGEMGQTNYVYMHPDDARAKGLAEKSAADIHSPTNTIRLPVKLLDTLMPGTVAIPHGWGHQHARGLSIAAKLGGANVNLLAADGADAVEPVSGMAHLTGIRVRIEPAAGPIDTGSWTGIAEGAAA